MIYFKPPIIKEFLIELSHRFKDDQVSAMATKLTFFLILSAFPMMIVMMELVRITNLTNTSLFLDMAEFIPDAVVGFLVFIFTDVQDHTTGTILPFALLIALWSSSRGINALIQSLNRAYRVKTKRNFILIRFMSFGYTIAFLIAIIFLCVLIIYGNRIYHTAISFINAPDYLEIIVDFTRYLFSIMFSVIFFNGIYNIVPIKGNKFISALPGTLVTTVGWIGVSAIFSIYVNYSPSLSYMYGSLTDIVIVMLWLYICCTITITGGEINAIFGHLKEKYGQQDEVTEAE